MITMMHRNTSTDVYIHLTCLITLFFAFLESFTFFSKKKKKIVKLCFETHCFEIHYFYN